MSGTPEMFDRALLARRRGRAARQAPHGDVLMREIARDITDRLETVLRRFPLALDLGGGRGEVGEALLAQGGVGQVVRTDLAPEMLREGPGARLVCDEERLPFAPLTFDLAVSALALHWVNDLPGALIQLRRALKPDGLFLGAMLGGETLRELAHAMMIAETEHAGGASPRVGPFADVRTCGALLQRAGFAMPVADIDRLTISYETPFALVEDLRAMGATNVLRERSRAPLGRETMMRMVEIYAATFGDDRGRVSATFDIITLTGWGPADGQPKPLRPGTARRRLADALGVSEISAGEKTEPEET